MSADRSGVSSRREKRGADVSLENAYARVAEELARARRIMVVTGAGISAESGLRTFRGASKEDLPPDMRSLWAEFDPATLATPQAFEADPEKVSRWYDWRRLGCLAAEPNAGHVALARIEREVDARGGSFGLFTQNVDRLHQRAGSRNVHELHGSIIEWRCTSTGRKMTPDEGPLPVHPSPSPFAGDGLLRPDVVWFGEMLDPETVQAATQMAATCEMFFSIGTSSVVYPAAGFVSMAAEMGAFCVEINREDTPASGRVDVIIRASAGEALPKLASMAFGRDRV